MGRKELNQTKQNKTSCSKWTSSLKGLALEAKNTLKNNIFWLHNLLF